MKLPMEMFHKAPWSFSPKFQGQIYLIQYPIIKYYNTKYLSLWIYCAKFRFRLKHSDLGFNVFSLGSLLYAAKRMSDLYRI